LFVVGGLAGGLLGIKMMDKIPKEILAKIFAGLLFVISGYIMIRSLLF
jgi:uncharacterized membrane protein YfcA